MGATGYLARLRECVGHDLLLVPAAAGCIRDGQGRILLLRRSDGDNLWGLPGGGIELGERAADAVVREKLPPLLPCCAAKARDAFVYQSPAFYR